MDDPAGYRIADEFVPQADARDGRQDRFP